MKLLVYRICFIVPFFIIVLNVTDRSIYKSRFFGFFSIIGKNQEDSSSIRRELTFAIRFWRSFWLSPILCRLWFDYRVKFLLSGYVHQVTKDRTNVNAIVDYICDRNTIEKNRKITLYKLLNLLNFSYLQK